MADEVPNWKPDSLHYLLDRTLKALTAARQGLRTDILLGSFMLSLAKPPANLSQKIQPANLHQQIITPVPAPAVQAPKPVPHFDPNLKDVLLDTAHQADFVLYCALFDIRPAIENNTLILDVEHAYSYDRLRLDDNAVKLTKMFRKFGKVILRYGSDKTVCPEPTDYRPKVQQQDAPKTATTQSPEPIPAQAPEPVPTQSPEPVPTQSPASGMNSLYWGLTTKFS